MPRRHRAALSEAGPANAAGEPDALPKSRALEVGGIRAKALSAAMNILAEQGVEALNLRAIAESAGVGIASIYHYFANKEQLLLSLALGGFDDLRRDMELWRKDPELQSPMRGAARAFFNFAQTRPALFSLMFSERLMARHEALREAEHRIVLAYQAAVQADTRIPAKHQVNAAHALWALGRGIASIVSSRPNGALPADIAEKLFAGASFLIDRPE
jgi:AcrR family transcriptional regulator